MSKVKTITCDDFIKLFECCRSDCPETVLFGLSEINTQYHEADTSEIEEYILSVLKLIHSPEIVRSRDENYEAWEKGWREQLDSLSLGNITPQDLKPKYFRPSKFLRFNRKIIVTDNQYLEYELFTIARYLLFTQYLSESNDIYELGCGSCQNLLMLAEMFPTKKIYGLDWSKASLAIADLLHKQGNGNIQSTLFDMMQPPEKVSIKPDSAIITVHAMEQLGGQHEELLSFIVRAKPAIVLHYEPILEFYDHDDVLDYLAFMYSEKRNYLSGFLKALCQLKEQKKIEIVRAHRPTLGGIIHEASLIVWRPL